MEGDYGDMEEDEKGRGGASRGRFKNVEEPGKRKKWKKGAMGSRKYAL